MFKTILTAAVVAGGFIFGSAASAATYTPDDLLCQATLANSGESEELALIAGCAGGDVSDYKLDYKLEGSDLANLDKDDAGNWFYDVDPDEPGYFILKFGNANGQDPWKTHYVFQNLYELTKLVFTNAQIDGALTQCIDNYIDCKLSHISVVNGPTPIPLPAGGLLLLTALAGAGAVARRRKTA